PTKGEVPDGEIVDTLGSANIVRPGKDATILALALMVPRALAAAEKLKAEAGIDCEVIDVRSLVPLDTQAILGSLARTHRLFTVEENPRLCGWGAEIVSIVADEAFYDLDGPAVRITPPQILRQRTLRRDRPGDREQDCLGREREHRRRQGRARRGKRRLRGLGGEKAARARGSPAQGLRTDHARRRAARQAHHHRERQGA